MPMRSTSYCKPDLWVALALVLVAGMLAGGAAQASGSGRDVSLETTGGKTGGSETWWQSIWGMDLSRKLKEWRPKITVYDDGEGFNLAHPFGKSGPTIQCSSSLPDSARRGLRAGGDPHSVSAADTDVFVFLQKRW